MQIRRLLSFAAAGAALAASTALLAGQPQLPYKPSPGVSLQTTPGGVIAFLAEWDKAPRLKPNVAPEAGKIVIVKFSDWECPMCKATAGAYKPTFDAHGARIKYVEKDYPLNSECNAQVTRTVGGHEASCLAAAAMRLARANKGQADALGKWIFDHQDSTPQAVAEAARTVGGVTNLSQLYPTVLPGIRKDVAEGTALGVDSTPGYFINGVLVVGFVDGKLTPHYVLMPDLFDMAVQHELKKAGIK
jgi:protein-disulfide isomerase